jgi:hypothetical protein
MTTAHAQFLHGLVAIPVLETFFAPVSGISQAYTLQLHKDNLDILDVKQEESLIYIC